MAETEEFKFTNEKSEEQTIQKKDLVAVIPNAGLLVSKVIYVEQDKTNASAPPTVKVSESSTPPTTLGASVIKTEELHVVLSTGSGIGLVEKFYKKAVSPVLEALYPGQVDVFQVHYTTSATSVLEFAKGTLHQQANWGHRTRVILLAGDGGTVDIVNGLLSQPRSSDYRPPQVILLPLGTANALYHSINAGKSDDTWGLRALVADKSRPLPFFKATFSPGARLLVDEARKEEELPTDEVDGTPHLYGAVVGSWGMHASLVADSDTADYRKFGTERFKMAAKEALYPEDGSPPHAYKANIAVLKGGNWEPLPTTEHMYVLSTLVSNLEKTFTISPGSKPLDGSLHLVHFGPVDGNEAMRIMGLAYQSGKHVEDPAVRYESIDGLRIQFDGKETNPRWRRVCIDGKIVLVEEDGWVEIKKDGEHVVDIVVAE